MVGFLVDDQPFGTVIDEVAILVVFHGADFDPDGGDEGFESIDAFLKVSIGDELRVLAGNEENIAKSLVEEVLGLGDDLGDGESGAKNGVVSGESAILAVVNTFV